MTTMETWVFEENIEIETKNLPEKHMHTKDS